MIKKYKLFIFTEDPDKLVKFYTDVLELEIVKQLDLPKDRGYTVETEDGYQIWIAEHSEVSGKNKDPYRNIVTFYVDSVENWHKKVKDHPKIEVVQDMVSMKEFNPKEDRFVFTFLDPEGNCLQFIGPK